MNYKISVKAAEDLENIWLYTFEHWNQEQADRYLNLIIDEIEYIAQKPEVGNDLAHIRKNYKSSKVKSHIVFYRKIEKQNVIEIIRVLHQRMDIENRLND